MSLNAQLHYFFNEAEAGRVKSATRRIKPLLDENVPRACLLAGVAYLRSFDNLEHLQQSVAWLRIAERSNLNLARYFLGQSYLIGCGVRKNSKMAEKWFIKAAKHGCAGSMFCLGMLYWKKRKVPSNVETAMQFLTMAASQEAVKEIIGFEDQTPIEEIAYELQQDSICRAQENLAIIYSNGLQGVDVDPAQAVDWLGKAIHNGVKDANYDLAKELMELKDYKLAEIYLMKEVSDRNKGGEIDPNVYFDLAKIFHHGLGHGKSLEIAERFYRKAAEAGHVEAKSVLTLNPDFHGIILANLAKKPIIS